VRAVTRPPGALCSRRDFFCVRMEVQRAVPEVLLVCGADKVVAPGEAQPNRGTCLQDVQ
jgi:hypothetical protein